MNRIRSGFTIIELLVTMAVASIVMGIGLGVFITFTRSSRIYGETTKVTAIINGARNAAVAQRSPALVNFTAATPAAGTDDFEKTADGLDLSYEVVFSALVREPVALWHFEEIQTDAEGTWTEGSRGYRAYAVNPAGLPPEFLSAQGRVGEGLYFPLSDPVPYWEAGREPNYIPVLNLREGLYISAWINPEASHLTEGDAMPVVSKTIDAGGSVVAFAMHLEYAADTGAFALVGTVNTESTKSGDSPLIAASRFRIRPGQWTHVAMSYRLAPGPADADLERVLTTFIDGQEALEPELSGLRRQEEPIAASSGPLRIGSFGPADPAAYVGVIDELNIAAYINSERQRLSGAIGFAAPASMIAGLPVTRNGKQYTTYSIAFDQGGKLDTSTQPSITLYSPSSGIERKVHQLNVSQMGSVEQKEWRERYNNGTRRWEQLPGSMR